LAIHTENKNKKTGSLKLNALLEITKAINRNAKQAFLLDKFKFTLKEKLGIEKVALYTLRNNWDCLLHFGFDHNPPDLNSESDVLQLKEISMFKSKLDNVFDIVIPVYHKERPLAYVLIGDVDEQKQELSPGIKHLPFIQTLTNIIIVAIENKRLFKENLEKIAITKELELASQMQSMLFPEKLPNNEKLQFHAFYLPNQEVGGDYYDFIQLSQEEYLFCIADVSGKGLSAALLMSNFQANLRALCYYIPDLKKLAIELNRKVMSNAKGEKFITFFCAKYNLTTRKLVYLNLGHHPAILFQQNHFFQLDKGSIGLGMLDELPGLEIGEVVLGVNALLLMYTDGLIENTNKQEEFFTPTQLTSIIAENNSVQLSDLTEKIMEKLIEHKENQQFTDDISMLSARFL
jgi:sigma-B regulation protein RsbU (phosphoserine phosphatase)